jgi:hypothetical protein
VDDGIKGDGEPSRGLHGVPELDSDPVHGTATAGGFFPTDYQTYLSSPVPLIDGVWTINRFPVDGRVALHFISLKNSVFAEIFMEHVVDVRVAAQGLNMVVEVADGEGKQFIVVGPRKRLKTIFTELGHPLSGRPKRRKKVWIAAAMVAGLVGAAAAGGFAVHEYMEEANRPSIAEQEAAYDELDDPREALCEGGIGWRSAQDHLGETVNVWGPVERVSQPPGVSGSPTFLEVGNAYPDTDRLNIVIWGQDADGFISDLEDTFQGESVCVLGEVESYNGVPQITVRGPASIVTYSEIGW